MNNDTYSAVTGGAFTSLLTLISGGWNSKDYTNQQNPDEPHKENISRQHLIILPLDIYLIFKFFYTIIEKLSNARSDSNIEFPLCAWPVLSVCTVTCL